MFAVIVPSGTAGAAVLLQATRTMPIVFVIVRGKPHQSRPQVRHLAGADVCSLAVHCGVGIEHAHTDEVGQAFRLWTEFSYH
jgi:hypothetical protein